MAVSMKIDRGHPIGAAVAKAQAKLNLWWRNLNSEQHYTEYGGVKWPTHVGDTGLTVTESSVMRHAAVYSCARIIAETIGSVPMRVMKRAKNGGFEPVDNHQVDVLLRIRPNARQTPSELKRQLTICQELRGNAWLLITRKKGYGREPYSLVPVMPDRIDYRIEDGREIILLDGDTENPIDPRDMIHLPHLVMDEEGLGKGPIQQAISPLELGLATSKSAGRFYGKGHRYTGVISHPEKLKPGTGESLANRLKKEYGGVVEKGHGLMVLDEGMKYDQLGMTPEDMLLLDAIKATKTDIASIFRVPLFMLQELEDAHYNNMEQLTIQFHSAQTVPRLTQWEEEMTVKLLTVEEILAGYQVWFDIDALHRADLKTRSEHWKSGVEHGYMSPNDVRGERGKPPVENGDEHYRPANLIVLGERPPERPSSAPAKGGTGGSN